MPGPSGLPNTLASDGAELQSAVKSSDSSQPSISREASPASPTHAADMACENGVVDCEAVEAQHGMQSIEALLQNPVLDEKSCISPQQGMQVAQALLHGPVVIEKSCVSSQPLPAEAGAQTGSDNDVTEPVQPSVPEPDAQPALPQEGMQELGSPASADGACAARPQLPSVPDASQQPAADTDQPQAHAPIDAVDDASPMHEPICEEMVLPDSVAPSQHGQQSVSQRQAAPDNPYSSPKHSQLTSASLEAACVLAALASGEKRPTAGSTADQPELAARSHKQRQHKQCPSSRAPLKTIQRTIDVQRQPIKPAWQPSGRAETSWGAKGRRTRARGSNLSCIGSTRKSCGRAAKQSSGSRRAAPNSTSLADSQGAPLSSEHAKHQACDSGKQTELKGAATDSTHVDNESFTKRPKLSGSKHLEPQQLDSAKTHEVSQPASLLHDSKIAQVPGKVIAQDSQENVRCPSAAAAVVDDDDDDDDFKPDVRRWPKSHQSSKGRRKRAKLSLSDTPLCSPEHESAARTKPVGQVLLSWNAARCCWDQRIITAFNATKVNGLLSSHVAACKEIQRMNTAS